MKHIDSIKKTKEGFEASFKEEIFYNIQTRDEEHLELILNYLSVEPGMRILDLGTGTGYLAFAFAQRYQQSEVVGLDIVEKTLNRNSKRAKMEGLNNLHFVNYDGMKFPFDNNSFDIVITRYALHHFPEINETFGEINRVLKLNGRLFLSDPSPNDDDKEGFVDAFMQMKKDGHIKFYTKNEWRKIGELSGMNYVDGFETNINFPRKKETALEIYDIMSQFDKEVIKGYGIEFINDEIWIRQRVNNLLFKK